MLSLVFSCSTGVCSRYQVASNGAENGAAVRPDVRLFSSQVLIVTADWSRAQFIKNLLVDMVKDMSTQVEVGVGSRFSA